MSEDFTDEAAGGPAGSEPPWWHASFDEGGENPAGVGTATQEAVRLAAAVAAWADQNGLTDTLRGIAEQTAAGVMTAARAASSAAAPAAEAEAEPEAPAEHSEHSEHGGGHSTCDVCPFCQGVDLLKTVSPEAAGGLTEAMAAVSLAVRQAVGAMAPGQSSPEDTSTRVEHINID